MKAVMTVRYYGQWVERAIIGSDGEEYLDARYHPYGEDRSGWQLICDYPNGGSGGKSGDAPEQNSNENNEV